MYTNIVNIPDSILFLTSCRLAIKESVNVDEEMDKYTRMALTDFVMNEATDYQIMSIVVEDEYVEEKYDIVGEAYLFDQYKEMVVDNIDDFSSIMETEDLKSLLYEIGPISQEGLSTAAPILEFLHESGVLLEKGKMSDFLTKAKDQAGKAAGKAKDVAGKAGDKAGNIAGKAGDLAGKAKDKAGNVAFDARFKARGMKKRLDAKGNVIKGKMKGGVDKMKGGIEAGKQKASDAAFDARVKARGLKKRISAKATSMKNLGTQDVKTAMGTKTGKAGAIALAAAAIYGGVKAYQRFFSQAARACGGKSGGEKTACMQKAKANAVRGQISATQRGVSTCGQAKDPAKCKASIQARVQKLQGKLAKYGG